MKRRKRNYGRAVWAALLLAGCCAIWVGACMPADDASNGNSNSGNSNGNSNSSSDLTVKTSECDQLDDTGNEFETKLTATSKGGQELTYSRRVITSPDQDSGFQVETVVMADGELVMSVVSSTDGNGGVDVQVEYGPKVPGLSNSNILVENGMISGKINDRDIVAMPVDGANASATAFEDGGAAPESGLDPDLEAALAKLFEAAQAQSCGSDANVASNSHAKIPPQDDGHDSDPEKTAPCVGCWAACTTGTVGCVAGVSAGCVAALFFYAACEAIGLAACAGAYAACVGLCNMEGAPCCPVGCGDVACCESSETCLNFEIGLCCAAGKTPCVGENCCSSTQVCINSGPNAGVCCQPEAICGNTCCDSGESCVEEVSLCCTAEETPCDNKCCPDGETCLGNGNCCEPINACGTACCDPLDSCIESLNLCCGFNEPACGNKCCNSGEQCLGGNTCCPVGRSCGNICCPAGNSCDQSTLTCVGCPNPTDTPCAIGGCCPAGLNCTDVQGECCPQGQTFCNGACRPISQCIS